MTNAAAAGLALLIIAALIGDRALTGGEGTLFVVRRFFDLARWLMFWR